MLSKPAGASAAVLPSSGAAAAFPARSAGYIPADTATIMAMLQKAIAPQISLFGDWENIRRNEVSLNMGTSRAICLRNCFQLLVRRDNRALDKAVGKICGRESG